MTKNIRDHMRRRIGDEKIVSVFHQQRNGDFDREGETVELDSLNDLPDWDWDGMYESVIIYTEDNIYWQHGDGYEESSGSMPRNPEDYS